ncbi:iron ABC transporter ATP-binding protein [Ilumatobacter coccineus]|uniref:Iron siderophore ABC transporter ATP-binding protein n=1 Tax=Ilumatobacter coccineus (strain NBRC 103263 / KCTC 29153 / YM16-304) TaxID=1313172 RepID=A0A6C7EFI2_ILUCY|nr:ATP-binding cassette domain-containing protein [Ilumatobacter coccineus]BAN03785.1 iron siderophore ABC transporter ATP-binding protein [Ilumatobacter coccineus YM16-304]
MIRAEHVSKAYGTSTVLCDVDLSLLPGKLTAIVGANGAGKSTLLSIISRLTEADAGTVHVDELDIARAKSDDVAKRLAVLRQDTHMTSRLTVRELVAFGRFPHSGGRLTPDDDRIVDEALDFFELGDLKRRHLDQLSGGQRQRAFVALALAQDTPYVLLDEPLNNLDMRHSVRMMRHLRRLVDQKNKSVVIVIHDLNFAAAHADHIVALKGGDIVAQGRPVEVMTPAILESIYDIPIDVHIIDDTPYAIYYR